MFDNHLIKVTDPYQKCIYIESSTANLSEQTKMFMKHIMCKVALIKIITNASKQSL